MKIVCMDCQTESYADVELLKDKKRFECEHCAENLPVGFTGQVEEAIPLPSNGNIELYTGPVDDDYVLDHSVLNDMSRLEEDDVLDISVSPSMPEISERLEIDEVISLPLYESTTESAEEAPLPNHLESAPYTLETEPVIAPVQLHSEFIPSAVAPVQRVEQTSEPRLVKGIPSEGPSKSKGLRLVRVSTPVLLAVTCAFVLFVVSGNMLIAPKGEVRANSAPAPQTVSPAESKPVVEAAPAASPEVIKPAPTPAAPPVAESKPAEIAPAVNQTSVVEKGQFTVQVGSHNDMNQANDQVEKLRAAGFESRVVGVDIPKRGRWYRVQAGSFGNRDEANRYGAQIVAKGAAENFVIAAP
jgi:cell division protein FtsN